MELRNRFNDWLDRNGYSLLLEIVSITKNKHTGEFLISCMNEDGEYLTFEVSSEFGNSDDFVVEARRRCF